MATSKEDQATFVGWRKPAGVISLLAAAAAVGTFAIPFPVGSPLILIPVGAFTVAVVCGFASAIGWIYALADPSLAKTVDAKQMKHRHDKRDSRGRFRKR